jgi:hypothetical protein
VLGDKENPVTQNGYAYADNNPVMKKDPDGNYPRGIHGTTPLAFNSKQWRYAHKAGMKNLKNAYSGDSKIGLYWKGVNAGAAGYYTNKSAKRKMLRGRVSKASKKAALKLAGKAALKSVVGPLGSIPDIYIYTKGFVRGWNKYAKNKNRRK